jgi:DNA-binding GntR family transcriptional regulator
MSGHRKLLDVWLNLENQLQVFLTIEKNLFENSYQFVTTHHPILEAIKGRKIGLAQKAIRDHLKLAMKIIRQGYWERNTKKKNRK